MDIYLVFLRPKYEMQIRMNLLEIEEYGFVHQMLTEKEFSLRDSCSDFPITDYPQRSGHGYICLCLKGKAEIEIDMGRQKLEKSKLLIIFPNQIISLQNVSDDFSFLYLSLSSTFLSEILFRFPPAFIGFLKEKNHHEMDDREFEAFYQLFFKPIEHYYRDEENIFRREIIVNLLRNFFLDAYHKIKRDEYLEYSTRTRKTEIMERFCDLVIKNFRISREVAFYADKLNITPKYLSSILKELDVDQRSAKEWIDDYIIVELKMLLKSTNLSIQQIGNELNFPSSSYLCKYFRSHVGISPKEYREHK